MERRRTSKRNKGRAVNSQEKLYQLVKVVCKKNSEAVRARISLFVFEKREEQHRLLLSFFSWGDA